MSRKRPKSQPEFEEPDPNFDPNAKLAEQDPEEEIEYYPEPLVWTADDIRKRWLDLQNTAESLLYGNAPVQYGCNEFMLHICNCGILADYLTQWYQKTRKPDPQELEKKARELRISVNEMEAQYFKGIESMLPQYRLRARFLIHTQFLEKMTEAFSQFFYEINDHICREFKGKKISGSRGAAFRLGYRVKTNLLEGDWGRSLGRDVRTVQKWERENNLPVHRVPGGRGRTAFANHFIAFTHNRQSERERAQLIWNLFNLLLVAQSVDAFGRKDVRPTV